MKTPTPDKLASCPKPATAISHSTPMMQENSCVLLDETPTSLKLAAWTVELIEGDEAVDGFPLVPVGAAAQELVACGGLEPWIKQRLARA